MSQVNLNDIIKAIAEVTSQMDSHELNVTIQEAVQCILCSLYGVSSNVKHEVKPINGVIDLLRALNDPYVRKGLGLIIELLRSMGKCLEAAEKIKALNNGESCSVNLPCYVVAHKISNIANVSIALTTNEKQGGANH